MVIIIFFSTKTEIIRQFGIGYLFYLYLLSLIIYTWYFTWITPFTFATYNLVIKSISLSGFIYFILQNSQTLGEIY